jgi:hypothetical protein
MSAKNREKVKLLGHIFGLALGKKQRFCMIQSKNKNKNKNKSRLSRNAKKIYKHLYKKILIDR